VIAIFLLCIFFAVLVGVFVVGPFFSSRSREVFAKTRDGFSHEGELRAVLEMRDALLEKLLTGGSQVAAVGSMNDNQAFEGLVTIGVRLQRAGIPMLPSNMDHSEKIKVTSVEIKPLAFLIAFPLIALSFLGGSSPAKAQDFKAPPLLKVEGAAPIAQVHQFILTPGQGELYVQYRAVFSNVDGEKEATLLLPFPEGFRNLKISVPQNLTMGQSQENSPVVQVPLVPGINQVRAEFFLDAPFGKVQWKSAGRKTLPGWSLIFMPEQDGILRNLLETFSSTANVWPARIHGMPSDFRSTKDRDMLDPTDPNYHLFIKMPAQFTRHNVREGSETSPYPEFEVVGIVPHRAPLYALAGVFGAVLLSMAFVFLFLGKKMYEAPSSSV
jgi:hypothetical protein